MENYTAGGAIYLPTVAIGIIAGDSADGGQIEHSAYDPCIRHTGNSIHKMSGTNLRRKIQTEKQNGCN